MTTLNKGEIEITILDDGTIKIETSDMGAGGAAQHKAADEFLKMVARLAGGEVTETKLKQGHHHHHDHAHEGEHHRH